MEPAAISLERLAVFTKKLVCAASIAAFTLTASMADAQSRRQPTYADVHASGGAAGVMAQPRPQPRRVVDPLAWRLMSNGSLAYVIDAGNAHVLRVHCHRGTYVMGYAGLVGDIFTDGGEEYERQNPAGAAFTFPWDQGVQVSFYNASHRKLASLTLPALRVANGTTFRAVLGPLELNALRSASYISWDNTSGLGSIEWSGNNSTASLAGLLSGGQRCV